MRSGLLFLFLLLFIGNTFAQSPGIIIRPAAGAGATPLKMYRTSNVLSVGNNISVHPSSSLASGVYVLQLIAGNVVILNQKIQKVK